LGNQLYDGVFMNKLENKMSDYARKIGGPGF
jgi:hypothetical protein